MECRNQRTLADPACDHSNLKVVRKDIDKQQDVYGDKLYMVTVEKTLYRCTHCGYVKKVRSERMQVSMKKSP